MNSDFKRFMQFIVVLIALLFTIHYDVDAVGNSPCNLLKGIDQKLFQGRAPLVIKYNEKSIMLDRTGILHYYNKKLSRLGEIDLSVNHKKISRTGLTSGSDSTAISYTAILDNVLYAIQDVENTGRVQWKKEFRAPIKGASNVFNSKLAVLTADNYMYMLDATNGELLWSYYNGSHDIRLTGLYTVMSSHSASPFLTSKDDIGIVIVPFLNGELKAFDERGKILWSYKLSVDHINTPFTDIASLTPGFTDNIVVANKSGIAVINITSGNLIWSQPLQVQSINIDYKQGWLNVVTEDDRILGIDKHNGEIKFETKLAIRNGKYTMLMPCSDVICVISNKGVVFVLDSYSGNVMKVINVTKGVYYKAFSSYDELKASFAFVTGRGDIYFCDVEYR
ncbi:hypothetical protein BIY23_02180 [Wolbachia pipientis]|uniref:Pyrrolo-quinoline quinone repeat domain-containing protein n=1 Tax=Wolbachia pipientis TaxID=955 RepID=A0A1E7QKE9_WOLPI|nr:PQQ-binding-like beta-propeller repeat protein [Wolbachia pipientis]OEY86816.1 hypothetical protein BIY23_02180 [Wolbachia pipientis]